MASENEHEAVRPLDARWAGQLERLSAANERARRERMKALTLEAALREFEELCREVHQAYDGPSLRRSHPVGLIKYVRDRE